MIEESRPCHSLIKRLHSNAALFATTGGSANAYTADFTPDFTLTMDASFYLRIHATNTGASTLSVDGAAAKNLMKIQGASFVALAPGDVIANGIYQVIRDQTGDRYLIISRIGSVGINGSVTTGALGANTETSFTVTHGLGTDNVKIIVMAQGSVNVQDWGVSARRPDGALIDFTGNLVNAGLPSLPLTGNVEFLVRNGAIGTQTVTVHYSIIGG